MNLARGSSPPALASPAGLMRVGRKMRRHTMAHTSASLRPLDLFRLDGRVAIVSGASSGLGRRFASVLDAAGARVVVAARRRDRLEALHAELHDGLAVACDVSDSAQLDGLVEQTISRYGRIDVLVNNAGISRVVPAELDSDDSFDEVVAVNLGGTFRLTRRVAAAMLASGRPGSIVNVGSIFGSLGIGEMPQASYAASKGAVTNLTRELSAQWARKGIRVNALAPGWFLTEMTQALFDNERGRRWVRSKTPMGRAGEVAELDGALLFLASDASSYVTGQVLLVDGGWSSV
jgi:NAD(P)-dependent dehydrogenase (short-subunit alcohol dehydrogenase family)